MTLKEIADAAGVSVDTVNRKAKELYPVRFEKGKKTTLSNKEGLAVMTEIRKINFVELPQTAEVVPQTAEVMSMEGIMTVMAKAYGSLTEIVRSQEARIQKIELRVEQRQALLPAPNIKPRDHVSKIVREHAEVTRKDYKDVWKELYREYGYRTNSNPSVSAKNRSMTVMDYLDAEGQIETLEAVAMDLWGQK